MLLLTMMYFAPVITLLSVCLCCHGHRIGIGSMYGFAVVDSLKKTTLHVYSTYVEVHDEGGHLSRMQSIRKSFRQSLKRMNMRSMRGGQSVHQSYRPALERSGSARPSLKSRTSVAGSNGGAGGASPAISHDMPAPPRRDSVKTITFSAPNHLSGESGDPVPSGVLCVRLVTVCLTVGQHS